MTDLEITRLCAEAMGGEVTHDLPRGHKGEGWIRLGRVIFSPLTNDEQAMALVKRFRLDISFALSEWRSFFRNGTNGFEAQDKNLNRAICQCVALSQVKELPIRHST